MKLLKFTAVSIWVVLLSACVSMANFGYKVYQSSPDAVALSYITAFYSGDSRSIKKLLEPSVLAEIEEAPDTRLIFVAVENIGDYVKSGGGYKNLRITDIKKYRDDESRTYFYDIDLPYVSRHSPVEWMEKFSSISLVKDQQGLWWVDEVDGIYQL